MILFLREIIQAKRGCNDEKDQIKQKLHRSRNNIDQEELSRKAELDLYELKKIENGFKMPNLKEIVNICNFFKIGTQEFLEYEDVWIAK